MNLTDARALYGRLTPTQHPRIRLAHNGPARGDTVLLFQDDLGSWDRSGPVYPSKTEAFANVPAAAAAYYDPYTPQTLRASVTAVLAEVRQTSTGTPEHLLAGLYAQALDDIYALVTG